MVAAGAVVAQGTVVKSGEIWGGEAACRWPAVRWFGFACCGLAVGFSLKADVACLDQLQAP